MHFYSICTECGSYNSFDTKEDWELYCSECEHVINPKDLYSLDANN